MEERNLQEPSIFLVKNSLLWSSVCNVHYFQNTAMKTPILFYTLFIKQDYWYPKSCVACVFFFCCKSHYCALLPGGIRLVHKCSCQALKAIAHDTELVHRGWKEVPWWGSGCMKTADLEQGREASQTQNERVGYKKINTQKKEYE